MSGPTSYGMTLKTRQVRGCLLLLVVALMEGKKRKEKGGAEKARIKKKRMLEGDASKFSKITDLFRSQALTSCAGELTEKQLARAPPLTLLLGGSQSASQMSMCWYISDDLMT